MKNILNMSLFFLLFIFSACFSQQVNIQGRAVDENSNPIQGASVKLIKAGLSDNSDGQGKFLITGSISEVSGLSAIPGRIEAEDYSAMSGIQLETCTDDGSGQNAGYLAAGDWMEYEVNVTAAGTYSVDFRVASENTAGQMQVIVDDAVAFTQNFNITGGWQIWETVRAQVYLTEGIHTLRLNITIGDFNINWMDFQRSGTLNSIKPNFTHPISTTISIHNGILSFPVLNDQQKIKIEIFDLKGHKVGVRFNGRVNKGMHSVNIFPKNLPSILYIVKLQLGNISTIFKISNFQGYPGRQISKNLTSKNSLPKKSANTQDAIDKLEVSKEGYQIKKIDIFSYTSDLSDIVLYRGTGDDEGLPPIVNGAHASTTRYWDCCKPHCAWSTNMKMCDINNNVIYDQNASSGCDGGVAFQCYDYAPIEVNSKVSYGWAAFNNSGTQCGDCFQLDFQGKLSGKQMILQVINIGDGGQNVFDILIPGGGVGANNGCSRQWDNPPLGVQYGGFHSECGDNEGCIRSMCEEAFGDKPDLMRGCEWYLGWYQMAGNQDAMYAKVSCPQAIKDISGIGN